MPNLEGNIDVSLIRRGKKMRLVCSITRTPGAKSEPATRLRILGIMEEGLLQSWLLEPSDI
jgi:hypothetical protein